MADDAVMNERQASLSTAAGTMRPGDEDMPRMVFTRRRVIIFILFVASAIAFLYFVLPQIAGLHDTWERIKRGDHYWLGGAALFEVLAYLSYNTLFRIVMVRGHSRIDRRESFQITLAALAATRLFNAAGAGGVALTAWALRRSGMEARVVACRMVAFLVLLYGVYMVVLVLDGLALRTGLLPGGGAFAITVVPAILGIVAISLFLAIALLPDDFERRLAQWSGGYRFARFARRLATAPATMASGVRTAIALVRSRNPQLLGAVGWWGFDIAVLWACFHAFGDPPMIPIVVMGYFVGMLANLLPLPGGVGGVEGGMIGAFAAFGVEPGLAIVAVLAYRAFSFWLPTVPGLIAYLQLRRTVQRWSRRPSYT
jgi:putative heme transporter